MAMIKLIHSKDPTLIHQDASTGETPIMIALEKADDNLNIIETLLTSDSDPGSIMMKQHYKVGLLFIAIAVK